MSEVVIHKYEVRCGSGDVFYVDTLKEARECLEQEIEDSRNEMHRDSEWPHWLGDGLALHVLDDEGNELSNERGEPGIMVLVIKAYVTKKRPPPEQLDEGYDDEGCYWPADVDEFWDFKVEDFYNGPESETAVGR